MAQQHRQHSDKPGLNEMLQILHLSSWNWPRWWLSCWFSDCTVFVHCKGLLFFVFVICPIAIAEHGTHYEIASILLSVCLSVCLSTLIWSQCLFSLMKFCRVTWDMKSKNAFVRGQNSTIPSPVLPNFSIGRSKHCSNKAHGPLWWLRAQMTCLGSGYMQKVAKRCNLQFCLLKHKNGDQCIFSGNMHGLGVTPCSAIMRDRNDSC